MLPMNLRCSENVSSSYRQSRYVHNPMFYLIFSISLSKSFSYIETWPLSLLIIPVKRDIVVVFPAPLCPSKQKILDSYREIDILLTAVKSPKRLVRP